MTYEDLAKTFNILSAHQPNCIVMDWTYTDVWGIDLSSFNLLPSEIRMLAEIGWGLEPDSYYDKDVMQAWIHPESHTDEEIVELFNKYKSIYKYA